MSNKQVKLLNGNWLSGLLQEEILNEVKDSKEKNGRVPGLGVILVGDNPASRAYVARKEKVAEEKCGFKTFDFFLPENSTQEEVLRTVEGLNSDKNVDGILLQLPLPVHLKANFFIDKILPQKDADGLHPYNQGLLLRGDGKLRPCTPLGVMSLIDLAYSKYVSMQKDVKFSDIPKVDLSGANAVVIGRSILVGKPVSTLLLERNASVTQVHSKTKNIADICSKADILVAAVGVPNMVKANWVKKDAVVIDVGINRTNEGKLIGDVDFSEVSKKCFAIAPVPGGAGPMTVAMLMKNTLESYKKSFKI